MHDKGSAEILGVVARKTCPIFKLRQWQLRADRQDQGTHTSYIYKYVFWRYRMSVLKLHWRLEKIVSTGTQRAQGSKEGKLIDEGG